MFKLHKVGLLKEGDRFALSPMLALVDGGAAWPWKSAGRHAYAQVNRAAGLFLSLSRSERRGEQPQLNGNPEANVQLEVEGVEKPTAAPAARRKPGRSACGVGGWWRKRR
jgi:hypothetical protein